MSNTTALPWRKSLPMIATSVRFLLAPFLFIVLLDDSPRIRAVAAFIFLIASLTDWLDGYWARKFQAESNMGKFMDPIADKILVLAALVVLLQLRRIDPYSLTIILARDIFIGGLRSVAAADQVIIAAKPAGKWKTALQMIAIPCMFVDINWGRMTSLRLGQIGLWVSVVLSLWSAGQYTWGYYRER